MKELKTILKKITLIWFSIMMAAAVLFMGSAAAFAEDGNGNEVVIPANDEEEGEEGEDPEEPEEPLVLKPGWQLIDGNWYYADDASVMQTGWQKVDGKWYYLDPETGIMQTGFITVDDSLYYLNASGAMQTGWQKIGGQWYLFTGSGDAVKGWFKSGKSWYYLDPETGVMATGWKLVDEKWYFMNASGAMQTGWLKRGYTWYLLSGSGDMLTGWQKVGGKWYYLDPETGAMATGWVAADDTWYYMNSNGSLYTGWLSWGKTWYYLTSWGLTYTGLAAWYGNYYYVADGVYDPTYNGKATIAGISGEYDVVNGKTPGGKIQPSDELKKKAKQVLDKVGWNLKAAFDWCVMSYSVYTTGGGYGTGYYADYGFKNHYGNCYVMAATFVVLARELGYEAYQISGYIAGTYIHSWCEVNIGGTFYVFDPDFVVDQGRNGYQISYGQSGTWRYTDYYKMNN